MLKIHQDTLRAELNSYSYIKINFCVVYYTDKNTFFFFLKKNPTKQPNPTFQLYTVSLEITLKKINY